GPARRWAVAHLRLRRRTGPPPRGAPGEALPVQGRRRNAALVLVCGSRGAKTRCASRKPQRPRSRGVPAGLRLAGQRAPAHRGGNREAAARLSRAGEAPLRAAIRSRSSARLGRDPGGRSASRRGGILKRPTDTAEVERQIQQLVELRHADPHAVLGVHPDGDGVVVRAYRPDAERVTVLPDFGGQIPARHRKGGVFEARLNGRKDVFGYLLKIDYRGGASFTLRDSYSFPPTLGELDSHLVSEGRHERIWERLGAHPRHHQGVYGTSFAVWAPATASVIHQLDRYLWRDEQWMERRGKQDVFRRPMSVYEVHLSSWRRVVEEGSRSLTWKEAAGQLGDYVKGMGFTHVEFLPLAE